MIELHKELIGTILDIGGGGEGVIGQLYGEQVVAIDNSQEELDEVETGIHYATPQTRRATSVTSM